MQVFGKNSSPTDDVVPQGALSDDGRGLRLWQGVRVRSAAITELARARRHGQDTGGPLSKSLAAARA